MIVTATTSSSLRNVSLRRAMLDRDFDGIARITGLQSVRREEEKEGVFGTGATVNDNRAAVVNLSERARNALGNSEESDEGWVLDQDLEKPGIQASAPDETESAAEEESDPVDPEFDGLSDMEKQIVSELRARDRQVRANEGELKAAVGAFGGQGRFTTEIGPDGEPYVVRSSIVVSTEEGMSPQQTDFHASVLRSAAEVEAASGGGESDVAEKAETLDAEAEDAMWEILKPFDLTGLLRPEGTQVGKSDAQKKKELANPFTLASDPLLETVGAFLREYDGRAQWKDDIVHPGSYYRRAVAYRAA